MNEKNRIRVGALSDGRGKVLDEALWEIETQIEPENKLISNFVIKSEMRDMEPIRKDLKNNLRKKAVYNNNSDVELLDKFIRIHEKEIEKIRRFEI